MPYERLFAYAPETRGLCSQPLPENAWLCPGADFKGTYFLEPQPEPKPQGGRVVITPEELDATYAELQRLENACLVLPGDRDFRMPGE